MALLDKKYRELKPTDKYQRDKIVFENFCTSIKFPLLFTTKKFKIQCEIL